MTSEWKEVRLGDVVDYISDKIETDRIDIIDYVSTENLQPEMRGLEIAKNLPIANRVTRFKKGNILISNIRPYFKKIWLANRDGGCSTDVLALETQEGIDTDYIYYNLARDEFFNFVMLGAKGTKMPRGDKNHILTYQLNLPPLKEQKAIAHILSTIDDKIETNNQINKRLEEMAQTIFKQWFVDFEFPNEDGEPYKSSGGEMVESELGMIPKGWEVGKLDKLIEITSGKRPLNRSNSMNDSYIYPLVGASSVMGYSENYNFNEPILIIGRVGTHGIIQKFSKKIWASDNTLVIKSKTYEYVYQILSLIDYTVLNRGSTQPLITQTDIKNHTTIIPRIKILGDYESFIGDVFKIYEKNQLENQKLTQLRDTLLPKLMSGEIRVPLEDEEHTI